MCRADTCADPLFYLHHTYLDKLFWDWQQGSAERQKAVGGPNARPGFNESHPLPDSAFTTHNGDDNGTSTTAGHVLWMAGIMRNVTIEEVMDLSGDVTCATYV